MKINLRKSIYILIFYLSIFSSLYSLESTRIREIETVQDFSQQLIDSINAIEKEASINKSEKENLGVNLDSNTNLDFENKQDYKDLDVNIYDKEKESGISLELENELLDEDLIFDLEDGILEDGITIEQINIKDKPKSEKPKSIKPKVEDTEEVEKFTAAIVGDLYGNILFAKNPDELKPLASVTKMMTLMVTYDEISSGRVKLSDKVKITKSVATMGGSQIPMKEGDIFLLSDLIKASAVRSANNATYAIAKHVGKGDIEKFIKMMNKKAEKLGLKNELKFYTPAGLPTRYTKKPMDVGSARGIYKLSLEALKYKNYIKIASSKELKIKNNKIKIENRNKLIGEKGIYGIKTGYHKEAKYNIAVASKNGDLHLITVVLGGTTYKIRDASVIELLEDIEDKIDKGKFVITDKN